MMANVYHQKTTISLSWILLFRLLLGGMIFATGCSGKTESAAEGKPAKRPPTLVRVLPVTSIPVAPRVIVVGTIKAKRKSVIASGANGVVDLYHIDEGQWVKEGEPLSVLRMESTKRGIAEAQSVLSERKAFWEESKSSRPEEISEARFKMNAARQTRDTAKEHADRMKLAYTRKAINKDQYDDALERFSVADSLYSAVSAKFRQLELGPRKEKQDQAMYRHLAQQEHVLYLEAEKMKRTTKAPFPGYIVKEHSYVGQWLSKGDPVVTLAMLDEVDVVVNVDQNKLQHVLLGKEAEIRIPGYDLTEISTQSNQIHKGLILSETLTEIHLEDKNGLVHKISKSDIKTREIKPWTGRIMQIVPQSDWETGSRGFPVKVRVKNRFRTVTIPAALSPIGKKNHRKTPLLKEGMMATVTFHGRKVQTRLVPKDALVRTAHGIRLNLFRPLKPGSEIGSTIQLTVETGVNLGGRIQVTVKPRNPEESNVLVDGAMVVTEGGERLLPVQGNVKAQVGTESNAVKPGTKSKSNPKK
jgi:multidrug efflux pump subunit AcrA (membrane-fusion protein)